MIMLPDLFYKLPCKENYIQVTMPLPKPTLHGNQATHSLQ